MYFIGTLVTLPREGSRVSYSKGKSIVTLVSGAIVLKWLSIAIHYPTSGATIGATRSIVSICPLKGPGHSGLYIN